MSNKATASTANTAPVEAPTPAAPVAPAQDTQQQPESPATKLAKRNRLSEAQLAYGQQREDMGTYADAGVFYASKTPIANAIGAEVGIVTRDKKNGTVQRAGFGFYFRADHMCDVPFIDLSGVEL
jgi:hypothetical protein